MGDVPESRVVRGGGGGGFELIGEGPAPKNLLRLAPRAVPRRLVLRLYLGGPLALIGWAFAAFGMIFVLIFLPMSEIAAPDYDRTGRATIERVTSTSSSENNRTIFEVHYTFVDEGGTTRRGSSYTTNSGVSGDHEVHYLASDPGESRLAGMRSRPFPAWIVFVAIFPLVGLIMAGSQIPGARRAVHLLRHGVETRGKLLHKKPSNTKVNGRPVMALTFEYEIDGKTYQSVSKALDTKLLEDDPLEPMLYDPHRPSRATTLDHLPGKPSVGPDGELQVRPGTAAWVLILPIITAGLIAATTVLMMR